MHRGAHRYAACLLDVFETVLSFDVANATGEFAAGVGVSTEEWTNAIAPLMPIVEEGELDLGDAFHQALRACGREADPATVRRLLSHEARLLRRWSRVSDDVVPFLSELRKRRVRTALVSNCAESTRALLEESGLASLVDELVLSYEVGAVKPNAAFFRHALAALGVDPKSTLLIDDRPDYCRAAMGHRIDSVVMNRAGWGPDAAAQTDGLPSVGSLAQVLHRF